MKVGKLLIVSDLITVFGFLKDCNFTVTFYKE